MDEPDQTDRYQAMEACEPNPVGCMLGTCWYLDSPKTIQITIHNPMSLAIGPRSRCSNTTPTSCTSYSSPLTPINPTARRALHKILAFALGTFVIHPMQELDFPLPSPHRKAGMSPGEITLPHAALRVSYPDSV